MRVLALDSSQLQACVCLIESNIIKSEIIGSTKLNHSQSLLNYIDQVLNKFSINDVDIFAVGIGPGSFTGIRIGIATMKAFAQVLNKPMIAFSSLKALSKSITPNSTQTAIIKAYQGLVFVGKYDQNLTYVETVEPHENYMNKIEYMNFKYHYINSYGILDVVIEQLSKNVLLTYDQIHAKYLRESAAEIKWNESQLK